MHLRTVRLESTAVTIEELLMKRWLQIARTACSLPGNSNELAQVDLAGNSYTDRPLRG